MQVYYKAAFLSKLPTAIFVWTKETNDAFGSALFNTEGQLALSLRADEPISFPTVCLEKFPCVVWDPKVIKYQINLSQATLCHNLCLYCLFFLTNVDFIYTQQIFTETGKSFYCSLY